MRRGLRRADGRGRRETTSSTELDIAANEVFAVWISRVELLQDDERAAG